MSATIKYKPWYKVSSQCVPYRSGSSLNWTGTWKVNSALTNEDSEYRATGIQVCWEFYMGSGKNPCYYWEGGLGYEKSTFGFSSGWELGKWNSKYKFYPWTSHKLTWIGLWVRAYNNKGYGPWNVTWQKLTTPWKPEVSNPEQDAETGVVSCEVKQDRGDKTRYPSQRTDYEVWVWDSRTDDDWVLVESSYFEGTSKTLSYDVSDRQELTYDQYVRVYFRARAHGFNSTTSWVKKELVVGYPSKAVINGVNAPSRESTSKVTVLIDPNSSETHYVTGCVLETLVNTNYQSASDIPADANWTSTQSVDNAKATALSASVAELIPRAGNTSWVRVKTWNQIESMFYRYSEPVRLVDLETPAPTAEDDEIKLLRITPDIDGTSAVALFGWNIDGTDDSDYTEITWSDNEHAWRSTSAPNSYEFSWSDGTLVWTDDTDPLNPVQTTFRDSAEVHIEGIEEGKVYYVRGRRVKDTDGVQTYSNYTDTLTVIPSYTPPEVALTAPAYIARGDSLPLSWVSSGDAAQTSWEVFSGNVIVANGSDAVGSVVVDAERISELVGDGTSITVFVRVATGGEYITSDSHTVYITDAPVLDVDVPSVITSQEFDLDVSCSAQSDLAIVITSAGASGEYPDGTHTQVSGDSVYSAMVTPEWTLENGVYTATVSIPDGLDLYDGARYEVKVTASDTSTGLKSSAVEGSFNVEWAHQAPAPSDSIVITPSDTTDSDGFRTRKVEIALSSPSGAAEGDVYEVYRVTPDGAYLIAEDVEQDAVVTDLYAPYGSDYLSYRIAVRTEDGDIDWNDYQYELPGKDIRIDFGSQYVELPWNITIGDSFEKDFEARAHLGSGTVEGYWNETVRRTASFSTDLIRITERGQAEKLRALARYDAPVFVRLPNGCAYQANIDISGMDEGFDSASIAVALDGEEVALTDAYTAEVPERTQDTDPDGE